MSISATRVTDQPSVIAHRAAVTECFPDVSSFLVDLLGASLVAHIADVHDSTVRRWTTGEIAPQPPSERRIRNAAQVARLLLQHDASHTVRQWFIGMNPQLDDDAPADALRADQSKETMAAARAFVDGA